MIITLSGKSCAGKDTVGEYLIKNHGFTRYALADNLKKTLIDILIRIEKATKKQLTFDRLNTIKDIKVHSKNFTTREMLQQLSDDLKRWFGSDLYCETLNQQIKNEKKDRVVITDCRYQHEIDYFKNQYKEKNLSINILRNHQKKSLKSDSHDSEKNDVICEMTLKNYGSIADLYQNIRDKSMLSKKLLKLSK